MRICIKTIEKSRTPTGTHTVIWGLLFGTADEPCEGDKKGPFGGLCTRAHSNLAMPLQGPQ